MRHPPQESDLLHGGKAAGVIVAAVIATVVGVVVAWGIGSCRSRSLEVEWRPAERPTVPAKINAMESTPFSIEAEGLEQHQRDEQWLSEYGWVDKQAQLVHIPIDVAIELYLERQPVRGARR